MPGKKCLLFVAFFCSILHTASASDHDERQVENDQNPTKEGKKSNDGTVLHLIEEILGNNSVPLNMSSTETPLPPSTSTESTAEEQVNEESSYSMTIFFILLVVAVCILVTHLLIQHKFHYLPESVAIVLVGTVIGLFLKLLQHFEVANWETEEQLPPTMFFLILLPPIIFESGYNLHKGNFFQNIGTILLFAIFGTIISALFVGGGIFLLGKAQVIYKLSLVESFAFGSLISAVDPVATLAIFHALDADPILYMLVFGESVLNDAVSIVLTTTVIKMGSPAMAGVSGAAAFFTAVGDFCLMFFASSLIGVVFGLLSAMVLKFVDLRKTPSLEFVMMLVFSYAPYGLAEGLRLSGIMAILFTGIVMSHYTHLNLSPVTQITVQQTFRTIAYIAETMVFAYLGMAIFSFDHIVKPAFVIWSIVLILLGRACNIFPLSFIGNYFREHKITGRMQFIMWFSGLRGAIAFALSLHLPFDKKVTRVLVTTTLIIVLFTLLFLGGSTMPLMKLLDRKKKKKRKSGREVTLSKTKEMGDAVDSEHLSELTEEEYEVNYVKPSLKGFMKIDAKYLMPFFTRRFTQKEVREGKSQISSLASQWNQQVRTEPADDNISEDGDDEIELLSRQT